ncbi:MAG: SDR family NAD(P)-dependent oxidoreductase [Spongiibacteraceae bacterium]
MNSHPALKPGNVAVITGAASGIGLAAAKKFAGLGMKIAMADVDPALQEVAANEVAPLCKNAKTDVLALPVDVSVLTQVQQLKNRVWERFGRADVLMNNAGVGAPAGSWDHYGAWQKILDVNLWGCINGVQTFTEPMLAQQTPGLIINTGSKQGITCPPGNTAYNVSKAAIKALTEGLQHSLRSVEGGKVSAHLLVPGFTYTGMMKKRLPEKPPAAWTSEQVIDYLLERLAQNDFYIICPDNEVTAEMDRKRILWAAGDVVENRPALSRWHPDYQPAFEKFVAKK